VEVAEWRDFVNGATQRASPAERAATLAAERASAAAQERAEAAEARARRETEAASHARSVAAAAEARTDCAEEAARRRLTAQLAAADALSERRANALRALVTELLAAVGPASFAACVSGDVGAELRGTDAAVAARAATQLGAAAAHAVAAAARTAAQAASQPLQQRLAEALRWAKEAEARWDAASSDAATKLALQTARADSLAAAQQRATELADIAASDMRRQLATAEQLAVTSNAERDAALRDMAALKLALAEARRDAREPLREAASLREQLAVAQRQMAGAAGALTPPKPALTPSPDRDLTRTGRLAAALGRNTE